MPILVLEGVSRGFERGRRRRWVQVLCDACLDVQAGEIVGVVGGRAAGKTTLLRIAAGLASPDRGTVRLGDLELTGVPPRKRATMLAGRVVWVSRKGMSQKLEVEKIVGWPLAHHRGRREVERRATEMLERVGAADCAGQRWDDLSPWEQVLVGLAQGFAGTPQLIVIDDLLDGLGIEHTERASDLLRSLIADTQPASGVLISASDRDSVILVDRVWTLEAAKLTPTTGHHNHNADIIPFRSAEQRGGSRRVGSR